MKILPFSSLVMAICAGVEVHAQQLYEYPEGTQTRWTTFENPKGNPGAGGKENDAAKGHAFEVVQPGGTIVMLNQQGAGIVRRIWLTVSERSPVMLRSMRLEMFWDNAKTPAVSAPLGDFFGIGLGKRVPFESELFSDPEGRSFNCNIPMPFKTAARIVMINESGIPVTFFYDVDITTVQRHEKPILYFHTYWNRENKTKLGRDYTILPDLSGKGRFLGMNVGVAADTIYETSWFGEGEVKMYLDGDSEYPTIVGTGTEDYIGSAWGLGAYSHRYQGCPLADEKNKQWCFYRYHVPDPIYFQSRCKVTFQQMGGEMTDYVRRLKKKGAPLKAVSVSVGNKFYKLLEMNPVPDLMDSNFPKGWTNYYREDDVSSTAYFYLDQPSNTLPAIANLSSRTANLSDLKDKKGP